jgi:hypothetical protein
MHRSRSPSLRVAVALAVPAAVVASVALVASSTAFVACGPCNADIAATVVIAPAPPPDSCLTASVVSVVPYDASGGQLPRICGVGSETLRITNDCMSPLYLTSPYFLAEGAMQIEGGKAANSFTIGAHTIVDLVAAPNAVGNPVVGLSGTFEGAPISITVYLQQVAGDAGGISSDAPLGDAGGGGQDAAPKVDSGRVDATSHHDASTGKDAGKDAGKGAEKDASRDVASDVAAPAGDGGSDSASPADSAPAG